MSVKLIGNERFVGNKQVSAGETVSAIARVRHNYPEGSEQGVITISSDFGGELDSQDIPIQDGIITLSYSGNNPTTQNIKLEIIGGNNSNILSDIFINGMYLQALHGGGNNILITFVAGESRELSVTSNQPYTIQIQYIEGDTYSDIKSLFIDNEQIIINNIDQIDVLEHDTVYGTWNSLVMIDSTHFMLAYAGTGYDGFIKTFRIDENYNITQINVLEHDTFNGTYNSLVMIDSTHFMLAYTGTGDDGFIKTFRIDENYNIYQINVLEHDTVYGRWNSLVMIDSTHFMLAYSGGGWDGFIKTFIINESYNITQIDVLDHDTVRGLYNSLVMIDSTHFMLAYTGTGDDGFIKTFRIDENYNIYQIDVLEHDTVYGTWYSLVMIDSTHFMLAYHGTGYDGFIKTFRIDESYNITQIGVLEHDTFNGYYNSLVMIDSTHFMLAYAGDGLDGFIKTFSINESYNIDQIIDVLEHDTFNGIYNSLVMIDSTHFMLAYTGDGYDGFIKTFTVFVPADELYPDSGYLTGGFTPELEILGLEFE
jgi:hypothetical protein